MYWWTALNSSATALFRSAMLLLLSMRFLRTRLSQGLRWEMNNHAGGRTRLPGRVDDFSLRHPVLALQSSGFGRITAEGTSALGG